MRHLRQDGSTEFAIHDVYFTKRGAVERPHAARALASDGDRPRCLLKPPYTGPYQSWCVDDHRAAARLPRDLQPRAAIVAREAYLAAREFIPNTEICGLFSDDVLTIYSLLLMQVQLTRFTF